ncbi:MAG TPA: TrbC/VirB2 family protein [Terriglobales bacterium]|nr:TrbC/VirB2 family protein [Terriglobales bacterium]
MFRVIRRKSRIELRRFARAIGSSVVTLLVASPAFAQIGGDQVTTFLSNALTYAQGLGLFGAGFLVIWAVANVARERPSGKQWAGAGGALLLSSVLQLLRTFAG